MATEQLVIDEDPDPDSYSCATPVVLTLEVPEKAQSAGWGDMSFTRQRYR